MVFSFHRRVRRLNRLIPSDRRRRLLPRIGLIGGGVCFALLATVWLRLLWQIFVLHRHHSSTLGLDNVEPSRSNWTVFYHVYVPAKSHKNAFRIAQEQLEQIKQGVQQDDNKIPTRVYYTTVGDILPELVQASFPACTTPNVMECRHVQHLPQGTEAVSLQLIYDFCQQHQDSNQIVTYLHSKGSYHQHKVNERWRKHLTAAAVHPDCRTKLPYQCNVCGLHFYTQWTNFFPGNMWTASCAYIRQLLPPNKYTERQEDAVARLLWLRHRGVLASRLFADRLDRFGLERYSMEHWIGSHPYLQPCDMAVSPLRDYLKGIADETDYSWAAGPRHGMDPPADTPPVAVLELLQTNQTASRSEVFYLAGRLQLWYSLYQTLPESDSWIWSWFPDGSFWAEQMATPDNSFTGSSRVESIYETPNSLFPLSSLAQLEDVKAASVSIFGLIDTASAGLESQVQQISALVGNSKDHNIQIFYQDMEMTKNNPSKVTETLESLVRATPLPTWDRLYEGGTLHHLYEYCQLDVASPDDLVLHLSQFNIQKARTLLNCAEMIQHGTCNVCGDKLFTGSVLHFQEDSWIAECSYIQKLLPPHKYTTAMNRAASKVWVEEMKRRFVNVSKPVECLGTDASSLLSWVTSHPDVVPCQLPNLSTDPLDCDRLDGTDMEKDSIRLRSFPLLAGHLWRWNLIYERLPPTHSWVWTIFPDGSAWRDAVQRYGRETAVEMMTRQFADTSV